TLRQVEDSGLRLVGYCPIHLQFLDLQKGHASFSTQREQHRLAPGRGKHLLTGDSLELHLSKPQQPSVKEVPQISLAEEPIARHAAPFSPAKPEYLQLPRAEV